MLVIGAARHSFQRRTLTQRGSCPAIQGSAGTPTELRKLRTGTRRGAAGTLLAGR
eukprot:SAG31_NODE_4756_length_2975_cov_2.249652_4_plen_55_part_00